jgi:hypothetical protein
LGAPADEEVALLETVDEIAGKQRAEGVTRHGQS